METYPLTSAYALFGLGFFYLAMIKCLQLWMKDRPEFTNLKTFTIFHNWFMSIASLVMFVGITYELGVAWSRHNWDYSLIYCDPHMYLRTWGVDFWFYVFYLSKFYEYIDTILLVLKKKPVIFLHSFHHWVTPIIVWSAAYYPIPAAWMGPVTNTFVHVIMYAYYALCEYNLDRSYGSYVTKIQLIQFILNIIVFVFIGFNLPFCEGNVYTYIFLVSQYVFFLYLFIKLDADRKKRLPKKKE